MKLWRFSGTLLMITGIIHTVVAVILTKDIFAEMFRDGLINSTGRDYSRAFALWFLVIGILLILWGATLQHYIKKEQKPAPLFLGYSMLLFAVAGGIIEPFSGFWLFLPQAVIIISSNHKCSRSR